MAAKERSPEARISALQASLLRAKAEQKKNPELSGVPMANILSVSWKVLSRWTNTLPGFDTSGCYVRGGNGVEWRFKPVETVQWLLKYHEQKLERTEAKRVKTAAAIGIQDDELPGGYTIQDVNHTLAVVSKINEQKRIQGEHVPKAMVEHFMLEITSAARDAILSVPVLADPNGAMTPDQRAQIDDAAFQAAVGFAERVAVLGQ